MHLLARLSRPLLSAGILAIGLAAGGTAGLAQDEGPEGEDPVVASVNGQDIHYLEVIRSAQDLPTQYQQNLPQLLPAVVRRLVGLKEMVERGRKDGLASSEEVKERVAQAEAEAGGQAWLQQRLEAAFTEESMEEG